LLSTETARPSASWPSLEAESVAFIVCGAIGIASDEYSFGYVATWTGGDADAAEAALRARGAGITRAARTILDDLVEPVMDEPTQPGPWAPEVDYSGRGALSDWAAPYRGGQLGAVARNRKRSSSSSTTTPTKPATVIRFFRPAG
jgi:hypothetical protein